MLRALRRRLHDDALRGEITDAVRKRNVGGEERDPLRERSIEDDVVGEMEERTDRQIDPAELAIRNDQVVGALIEDYDDLRQKDHHMKLRSPRSEGQLFADVVLDQVVLQRVAVRPVKRVVI